MLALAALALFGGGCDGGEPEVVAEVAADDALLVFGTALGADLGGVFDVVTVGADAAYFRTGEASDEAGCTVVRGYEAATVTWTREVDCVRVSESSPRRAVYGRTQRFQCLDDAGAPRPEYTLASSVDLTLVEGYGTSRTSLLSHGLDEVAGRFRLDDVRLTVATVNGDYSRSAADTLTAIAGNPRRALRYGLTLTFDDVTIARNELGRHTRFTGGRISGSVSGTVLAAGRDGRFTGSRTFSHPVVVTFDGSDWGTAQIGSTTRRIDTQTGRVEGLE